jgi:hypothetical protein
MSVSAREKVLAALCAASFSVAIDLVVHDLLPDLVGWLLR